MNGVEVEISQQAVRPREPARPSRAFVSSSPEMLTRQLRPRETTNVNVASADNWLAQISSLKGQQEKLQALLKQMSVALKTCQAKVAAAQKGNDRNALFQAQENCKVVESDILLCINAIKDCAAKVNYAADAAVAKGASTVEVKKAAAAPKTATVMPTSAPVSSATSRVAKPIRQDSKSGAYVTPVQTSSKETAPAPKTTSAPVINSPSPKVSTSPVIPVVQSPSTTVVETNTPRLTDTGVVVPGPDATVVDVPTQSEPGATAPPATSKSGGAFGILALIAGVGVVWAFSKRGNQ